MRFPTARLGLVAALVATMGTVTLPSAAASARSGVRLAGQSVWTPEPGGKVASAFELDLAGPDDASVATVLYPRITTRSAFQATLATAPNGAGLDRTPATPLRCFATKAEGIHVLRISLANGQPRRLPGSASPQCRNVAPPSWALPCAAGSCSGVFPVVVTTSSPGERARSFTTFLTLTAAQPGTKLHAAVIFTVQPGVSQRSAATELVRTVSGAGGGGTLLYAPATVTHEDSSAVHGPLVAALAAARASRGTQVLASTFVPVDAGGLESAGLGSELVRQRSRAASASQAAGLGGDGAAGTWVAQGTVTGDLTGALQRIGVGEVVVSDTVFSPPLEATSSWGQPFTLATGSGSATAMATDEGLAKHLAAARREPRLAAYQLLADLAFLHYEEPYAQDPRGAIALDPGGAPLSSTFASTVLHGLQGNPVVQGETLRGLFAHVPSATGQAANRHLTLPSSSYGPTLARSVATTRARLQSLRGAAEGSPAELAAVNDQLLAAQRSTLSPALRANRVAATNAAVDAQLGSVQVSSGTITLTARTGTIPITITSSLGYPITGTLTFTSDKLAVASATSRPFTISRSTHAIRVGVRARTTGDLPLEVRFTAPDGLLIASGTITVRSTATSKVGIVITLAAAGVLALWWLRSHRRRRGEDAEG